MNASKLSRRTLIKAAAAAPILSGAGLARRALAADPLTIGVIYVGPRGDFGWNQAHAVGIQALKDLPNVKVVQEERVPETRAVISTIESLIKVDGAKLILGTSFGYFNPFMVDMAKKYPEVEFRHPTTLWTPGKHPANLGGYFCYLDQAHYINGVAAGLSTKTNKLGFVAAKPIPLVLRTINTFLLGARSVNPAATVRVVFTGDWSLPVREAEAANTLIDNGCDVLAAHVDSPRIVLETADRRGARSCGHNVGQAELAPKGFITGAELKYSTIYRSFANDIAAGRKLPNLVMGGYDKDLVSNTPFGAGATEAARKAVAAAIEDLKKGKPMFAGPLKDNKGGLALEKTVGNYDPSIENMGFLLDGVIGSAS